MSPAPESEVERIPVSPTRASLAANLERQAAIPQVTTFRTLDCTALEDLRRRIQVSPLPIVVAALTRTIAEHSTLNASWGGNEILIHRSVDVGIAVDTGRGLLVPVLRRAQAKGIEDLSREISRLAEGARRGTLDVRDLSGATVAVTNTGSYGSEAGTPMLAPGTAVTLGIGVIEQRALVIEGAVAARPACTLSLTFDHRVLDGATVGRALTDLVERLSSEERLEELPL
jgi:pyruvate dehydrogenase E2 component (dihydrolipoamide acetyltransferase)